MKKIWKNKQVWGTIIAVVLLAACFKDIKLTDIRELSERVSYHFLIPATITSFFFIICRALRWRLMITRQMQLKPVRAVTLYSAGQVLNIVMPVLTGQVGRLILFAKKLAIRKTYIFSTIVLEVLFDALTLIIFIFLTSLAFVFPSEYRTLSFVLVLGTSVLLILLYVMLQFQTRLENALRAKLSARWPGAYITIKKFIRSFAKGINLLRSSQHFAGSVIYSLLAWTGHMMVIWFLFKSFGFDLPIPAAAAIMVINTIVLMVPLTPGNAGTFEFAVSASLAAFGIGRTDAVLFALALHLMDLLPIVVMGMFFMRTERLSLRELRKEQSPGSLYDHFTENDAYVREEKV